MKILPVRFGHAPLHRDVLRVQRASGAGRPARETCRAASKSIVRRIGTNTCRPVLPEVFTIGSSDISAAARAARTRPPCPSRTRRVLSSGSAPLRLLARIDVRIDVEQHVVGIVEHRGLERLERASRSRCSSMAASGAGLRARMPDVELERARLREPEQRRQVVAEQVVVLSSLWPENTVIGLDERRPLLLPVLLEEALAVDAVGHADHRQRPVGEMRQHVRRHLREVAQQVALGERRLLQRGSAGQ